MNTSSAAYVIMILSFGALALTGAIGWVINIIKFCGMFGGDITPLFIGRIVGIPVPPLGAILGWFF